MTTLSELRAECDSVRSLEAEFGDRDADPGTIVAGELRRVRGRLLRARAATPRLCFAVLAVADDGDDERVSVVLKTRHGWVDEATIARVMASEPASMDVVGLVELGSDDVILHAVAFQLADWLHLPLRTEFEPFVREETIAQSEQRRVAMRAEGESVHSGSRNRGRAAKFVRFVLQRCGGVRALLRRLGDAGTVLDVAGGNGSVSFELIKRGVSALVVDPRATRLTKTVRHSLRRYAETQLHEHTTELATALLRDAESGFAQLNSTGVHVANLHFRALNVPFDAAFLTNDSTAATWASAGLVLGLHPDEPTEAIVDFCLAARKSFFVVPCCVFPKAAGNEHRRHITTTPAFCEFLRQKAPDVIHVDTITMEGRNECVWAVF